MEHKFLTEEDKQMVIELRNKGFTRQDIARELNTSLNHVRYIISLLPKTSRKWYRKERTTFTDAMPNPFPKWWCEKQGLDHNFYRPNWKK
jgi:transcriptional regulator